MMDFDNAEKCPLCDTMLEFSVEGGRRLKFMAHSPEFCATLTRSRIDMLTKMAQHANAELALMHRGVAFHASLNVTMRAMVREVIDIHRMSECVGLAPAETKRIEEILREVSK